MPGQVKRGQAYFPLFLSCERLDYILCGIFPSMLSSPWVTRNKPLIPSSQIFRLSNTCLHAELSRYITTERKVILVVWFGNRKYVVICPLHWSRLRTWPPTRQTDFIGNLLHSISDQYMRPNDGKSKSHLLILIWKSVNGVPLWSMDIQYETLSIKLLYVSALIALATGAACLWTMLCMCFSTLRGYHDRKCGILPATPHSARAVFRQCWYPPNSQNLPLIVFKMLHTNCH